MLNGLYGYIFGGESADSSVAQGVQSNDSRPAKKVDRGLSVDGETSEWILVGEEAVRKTNAEADTPHLLDKCKSLSSSAPSMTTSWCSEASTATAIATSKAEKRAAEQQQKRLANTALQQQRQWLTKMMFSDPEASKPLQSPADKNFDHSTASATASSARLKRACKVELVQSQAKTKPRSKKSAGAKLNSNRNNDRKCNPHNHD